MVIKMNILRKKLWVTALFVAVLVLGLARMETSAAVNAVTYTITFDANGGSVADESAQTGEDGKISNLPTPTRSGYTFTGWYTQASDGAEITTDTMFTENTTVYAQWIYNGDNHSNRSSSSSSITIYYTLTFEENGGSVIASISRASDTRVDLSEYTPNREGYTFTGWYSDSVLTTKVTTVMLTNNTTVYAGWTQQDDAQQVLTHAPYISGYTDGTFKPNASITRAETAQLLYNLLSSKNGASKTFGDVASGAWYTDAVSLLGGSGTIAGYSDGSFRPEGSITRAEFVTLVARYACLTETATTAFSDAGAHWANGYIGAAVQAGYLDGYADGSFRPDAAITRAEAVKILNRMMERSIVESDLSALTMPFSDVATSHWAYYEVLEAAVSHTHKG